VIQPTVSNLAHGFRLFQNSAIQCLSHATPLTQHFLSNKFSNDLNKTNPLGTGGKLAQAYADTMKELWMPSGRSCSSKDLKRAIAQFAPRFAGCSQHDAQEFLAYLLDGLHEDLNRVKDAPYVEMPDVSDGDHIRVAGARAWDYHGRRNDSLIMDNVYGQFKSTCVCPQCDRVSLSFDTFNHVSLEIPQKKDAIVPFVVWLVKSPPQGMPAERPVRYGIEMRRTSNVDELIHALANLSGIPTSRIKVCDTYNHAITDWIRNNTILARVQTSEFLMAYEVDSFDDDAVHALISHRHAEPKEIKVNGQTAKRPCFGLPLLTSFSTNLTCREVFEHVWLQVMYAVDPDAKDLLQLRATNGDKFLEIFPTSSPSATLDEDKEKKEDEDSDVGDQRQNFTSILPRDSDVPLLSYLGRAGTERFFSLFCEWKVTVSEEADVPALDSQDRIANKVYIDEAGFEQADSHPTYLEALKKRRALNEETVISLDQCFEHFIKPERLDEQNMWYCSNCKEHVRAMKTMQLARLPNILVIHLKRFEFKMSFRRDKLDMLVDFPLEGLDMDKHCASAAELSSLVDDRVPAVYDLFGVTNHFGRMGFGHYTAFARGWNETELSDEWTNFDDSRVQSAGIGDEARRLVVSPSAYVLFYRRRVFT
jgi:ubiquitin C-terminal hydrolase